MSVVNDSPGDIIRDHRHKSWITVQARLFLPGMMLLLASLPANAQDDQEIHPFLSKRFFTTVGIFFPDRSFKFDVDGTKTTTVTNEPVDFSERFGIDGTDASGAVEFGWRYSKNWILRGQYFRVNDSNSVVLDEDVEWGDTVFNRGTSVAGGVEVEVTRLFFGRTFKKTDDYEIGLGAGLHWLEIGASIAGRAFVDGVDDGFHNEAVSVEGPLPNIGAWYIHAFSPKWAANIRFDWLSVSIDKYDGRLINAAAGLTYAMSRHFGVGLSYNFFELDLTINDESWRGSTKNRFHGFSIYLSGYW